MKLNRRGLGLGAMAALALGATPARSAQGLVLSATPGEPGYPEWKRLYDRAKGGHVCKVYLDGRQLPGDRVDMADERRGVVRIAKVDQDGDIYVEPGTDQIARETLRGRVRIAVLV